MICPSCDSVVEDGARFCSSCGQSLGARTEERRVVSVLFADLVGFTSLSEHRDPESVKRVVDVAFERLARDVRAFGGRVDKIVGDAIIALFGAPVAHEDDAERAVRAALRMQESLAEYGREAGIDIRMRIGVNTGEVLVGAMRAAGDYTAMGDVVNLASRLQTAAEPGEVVVGDSTYRATSSAIGYESRGHLTARGREQSEPLWAACDVLRPPGRRRRPADTPLVGRDTELALLENSASGSIERNRAQLLLLVGEAGVGKTRLTEALAARLREARDIEEHHGHCPPYGEANPWYPFAEVLRSMVGVDPDSTLESSLAATYAEVSEVVADPSDVDSVVDGLLHLMGHEGPLRGLDGAAARAEATRALLTYLEGALRRRPLLVRISDMHWADDEVFDLLDEVCSRLARQPLVVVATARRAVQERWNPRGGRFNSLLLNLDPLDRAASSELLGVLSAGILDHGTTTRLLDRSGGNPFYLEELVSLLGRHVPGPGGAAAGATSTEDIELPETLRGLVAARVDALGADEQAVLGDASVWGPSGAVMVLDRIAAETRGVDSVAPLVQGLADKDVLVLSGGRWSFRSDLVREVTYSRLTKHDRLSRHAGIAEYLGRLALRKAAPAAGEDGGDASGGGAGDAVATGDDVVPGTVDDELVDTVARHYAEAAGLAADLQTSWNSEALAARAVVWVSEAARRAERNGAWPQADRLYGRALGLVGDDASRGRVEALLGRSRVEAEQWRTDGALVDAQEALALADELGELDLRAEALLRLAGAEMRRSGWDVVDGMLDEALEAFDELGSVAGRAEVLRQRGLARLLRGDHRLAEEPILGALEAFRSVGDRRGEGWAYQNLAWIAFGDGRVEEADDLLGRSVEAFAEVGDRAGLEWTRGLGAFVDLARGRFDEARDAARRIVRESERRDDRFGMGMMHIVLGAVELWTGHPRAALASAQRALGCMHADTDVVGMEQALALQGRALVMSGEVGSGLEGLREALETGRHTSTDYARTMALLTEVQVGLPGVVLGDGDAAWLREALAAEGPSPDGAGPTRVTAAALSCLQAGDLAGVRRILGDGAVSDPTAPSDGVAVAVLLAATGDPASADRLVDRVLQAPAGTYLDRVMALVVRALLDQGAGGDEALRRARAELAHTEDRFSPLLVDLAAAVRAEVGPGGAQADLAGVLERLEACGAGGTRWLGVFERIATGGGAVSDRAAARPAGTA